MRKIIFILFTLAILISCSKTPDTYTLQLNLAGSEGKWVKLMSLEDRNYVTFDSGRVEKSPAVLSKAVKGVQPMYLSIDGEQGSLKLLIENASYDISGSLEEPVISTDSKAQNDLNAYNEKVAPITDQMAELVSQLRTAASSAS